MGTWPSASDGEKADGRVVWGDQHPLSLIRHIPGGGTSAMREAVQKLPPLTHGQREIGRSGRGQVGGR